MKPAAKILITALRLALGVLMLNAGITKVINPAWSAAGYLKEAATFPGLFEWFGQPAVLPAVDFLNEWGLTVLGVCLIAGVCVRLSSILGALLMLLYYLPILDFPKVGERGYLVDEHIIYLLVLLFFAAIRAGRVWGLDGVLAKSKLYRTRQVFGNFLG